MPWNNMSKEEMKARESGTSTEQKLAELATKRLNIIIALFVAFPIIIAAVMLVCLNG